MKTKLDTLKEYAAANDWKKAISIAAKFPSLGKERNAILDAHLAYTNPRWSISLGKDVEQLKTIGIVALRTRYKID